MGQLLQLAGAASPAGQALHPVVGENQLQSHLSGLADLFGIGEHLHALIDRVHTGGHQALCALYLNHTDAACADLVQVLQVAEGRDLHPCKIGGLNNGGAGRGFHFHAVDFQFHSIHLAEPP